jgi:flagellar biosynthesis/type III secretory pathway protein FliH
LAAEPAVLPDVQNVEVTQTETHSVAAISETISDPISEPMSEPMSEPVQDAVAETAADAEATQAIDATEQTQTQTQTQAQAQAHTDEPVDVEAPTSSDAQTPLDAQADTTTEAEAVTTEEETPTEEEKPDAPVHALAEPEPTAETKVAAESPAETDMVESDLNDENTIAPEQMAASLEEVVEDITLPEPVLAGIDPEVAEQREAEKFAEGLAQGIEQGERQAREAMQQEVQAQCTVMANVTQELHALLQDSKAFYEPLKRLSLHLAEQIVMGELRTSTHAVEKLVQRCLDELDHPAQGLVVLELNPEDKTRLQAQSPELIQGMRLEAVQDMQPGSVRLFANDTVVEDLVEHRLEALAQSMLVDVATWKAQSALAKPDASTQDLESEDVHP